MRNLCAAVMAALFALAVWTPAMAQDVQQEVALNLADANHKALVFAGLTLTEDEASAFWVVFDLYLADLRELRKRRIELIRQYANSFANVNDADALAIIDSHYAIESDTLALQMAFRDEVITILPPVKAMRALQIESKLQATERFQITRNVPLVPPS